MGSSSFVPSIEGFGLPGTFLLREADDAMAMRGYAQGHRAHHAVVGGGGLLGLEAAYALHKLGLHVSVLERSRSLLRRQLDARGSLLLREYLEDIGITIVTQAEAAAVQGADSAHHVLLNDDRRLPCDIFLACAGIKPNVALARDAGLKVAQGVIVDDSLRTSRPEIFAVGDVAEHRGQILGLWPAAVKQAEVAASNAVGGKNRYEGIVPVTTLKVAGIDLTSIGRFGPEPDDTSIVLEEGEAHTYRKLVIAADGRIAGAILLGFPHEATLVTAAIKKELDARPHLEALRAGQWHILEDLLLFQQTPD
jgi:NAD(P)H-nitrite reductase large subunit